MVIWKYELEITDRQQIMVPLGARVLSVANQNGTLCLWALVEDNTRVRRDIEIFGTGNPIPPGIRTFIGTVLMEPFVWHVFEMNKAETPEEYQVKRAALVAAQAESAKFMKRCPYCCADIVWHEGTKAYYNPDCKMLHSETCTHLPKRTHNETR